jgi:hypothetical protein
MIASRFELVIFDCDGVLVDSEPIRTRRCPALQRIRACGAPPPWPISSGFAPDSPLEGDGFEPSVPRKFFFGRPVDPANSPSAI